MSQLLVPLFVFLCLLCFVRAALMLRSLRSRRHRLRMERRAPAWGDVAEGLFLQHRTEVSLSDRLHRALTLGRDRLDLENAIVAVHRGNECVVRALSAANGQAGALRIGAEVGRDQLFCGMLSEARSAIAIDSASVSDWRRHRAYVELGWETYIGVARATADGALITLGFFQRYPRENLFSGAEKEFVSQLATWVAALVERHEGVPISAPVSADSESEALPSI